MAAEPIGHVESLTGEVFAVRAAVEVAGTPASGGVREQLEEGSPVFQGDTLETGPGAAVGIVFVDDTTFALDENASMVLDELIFDPDAQEGSAAFSVLQGAFTFVTGQIADAQPENVIINTPVATIGIRGTKAGCVINVTGGNSVCTIFEGAIIVSNSGGQVILEVPGQSTRILNFVTAPGEPFVMTTEELEEFFDRLFDILPDRFGSLAPEAGPPPAGSGTGGTFRASGEPEGGGGRADEGVRFTSEDIDIRLGEVVDVFFGGFTPPPDGRPPEPQFSLDQILIGTDGDDILIGGPGNDILIGLGGNDFLDGGPGIDTAVYFGDIADFLFGLGSILVIDTNPADGDEGTDTLINIELIAFADQTVLVGGPGDDVFIGDPGDDVFIGLGGDDILLGGLGDDFLIGLGGNDFLDGGPGIDTAVFLGNFADYTFAPGILVTDTNLADGDEGTDTLINIELLQFADQTLSVLAADDAYGVGEDDVLTLSAAAGVLANDTDLDGDALTAALVSGPSNGTLSLNPDGSFTYTPDVDFNGTDSFTYKASDGTNESNLATVTITVEPQPTLSISDVSVNEPAFVPAVLYVLDHNDHPNRSVLKINADGSVEVVVDQAAILSKTGESFVSFNNRGIAVDSEGNVYFTESVSDTILKLSTDGSLTVLTTEAAIDVAAGGDDPRGLVIGPDGTLYVVEEDSDSILAVNPDSGAVSVLTLESAFTNLDGISSADFDAGITISQDGTTLYVVSETTQQVIFAIDIATAIATEGAGGVSVVVGEFFGTPPSPFPTFNFGHLESFLTVAADGDLIVADEEPDTIYRIDPATGEVEVFLSSDDSNDKLGGVFIGTNPDLEGGIAFDADGNFYVTEENSDQVLRWATDPATGDIILTSGEVFVSEATIQAESGGDPDLEGGIAFFTPPDPAETTATFTVTLSEAVDETVTVAFTTADGTAISGGAGVAENDYGSTSGTLTFAPGETTATIEVTVFGDVPFFGAGVAEGNETFLVTLSDPVNATITDATGTGTIVDVVPALSIGDVTVQEPSLEAGLEFQVNTFTVGSQRSPSVAALADDGFVVTWTSVGQDDSSAGVFGQRFGADGSPVGAEFQVNTFEATSEETPSVAALADGGFVVTWQSFIGQDDSGGGVFGQRFDADGSPVGAEFQVNTFTPNNQMRPSVAALADGGFVVIWMSDGQDVNSFGVFGQRFDADGSPVGAEFQVNTFEAGSEQVGFAESVAALADGGFVVAWVSFGDGIFGQRFGADGSPVGAEFQVHTFTGGFQRFPSVAALADGGFVVAWESLGQDGSGFGVFGQRFGADGSPVGAEFQVNTFSANDQKTSSVAALADGGFVVTWQSFGQDGSSEGVFGQRFGADGSRVGAEFQVNTFTANEQRGPSVAALADGGFVVTWTSFPGQDGSSEGVFGKVFPATATFTVSLSEAVDETVTIDFATVDGSALAGVDYVAKSGTLTFSPGETTATIEVTLLGDTVFEGSETFSIVLSDPTNATIANGTGTGTILPLPPGDDIVLTNIVDGSAITIPAATLLANDDSGVTIASVGGAVGGGVVIDGNGDVVFTTTSASPTFSVSFTYTVTDGSIVSDPATVTIDGDNTTTISGTGDDDILIGRTGTFTGLLDAGDGDDWFVVPVDSFYNLEGGAGTDTAVIVGSAGIDSFDVSEHPFGGGDTHVFIENELGGGGAWHLDDVEDLVINLGGGDDEIVIGDLSGTDITGSSIEVDGGAGDDTVNASGLDSGHGLVAFGGSGQDTLTGGAGNDFLDGGPGSDTLDGGAGFDIISYSDLPGPISVVTTGEESATVGHGAGFTEFTDTVINAERIDGTNFDDTFTNAADSNSAQFIGRGGDDTFIGSVTPGLGESVNYIDDPSGVVVTPTGGAGDFTVADGFGGTDTITDIETIFGSNFDDVMNGSPGGEEFIGEAGNDTLTGGAGDDELTGGAGNDTFIWNPDDGSDNLEGGAGADTAVINGSEFRDVFEVEEHFGEDSHVLVTIDIDGNESIDGILHLDDVEHLVINLGGGDDEIVIGDLSGTDITGSSIEVDGGAGDDTVNASGLDSGHGLVAFGEGGEDKIAGGLGDDQLFGGNDNDELVGLAGDDILIGGAGDDMLFGFFDDFDDFDADTLSGGDGDDTLVGGFSDDLIGGGGDDVLQITTNVGFGSGVNLMDGGTGLDTLEVASSDFNLAEFSIPSEITGIEIIDIGAMNAALEELTLDAASVTTLGNNNTTPVVGTYTLNVVDLLVTGGGDDAVVFDDGSAWVIDPSPSNQGVTVSGLGGTFDVWIGPGGATVAVEVGIEVVPIVL